MGVAGTGVSVAVGAGDGAGVATGVAVGADSQAANASKTKVHRNEVNGVWMQKANRWQSLSSARIASPAKPEGIENSIQFLLYFQEPIVWSQGKEKVPTLAIPNNEVSFIVKVSVRVHRFIFEFPRL